MLTLIYIMFQFYINDIHLAVHPLMCNISSTGVNSPKQIGPVELRRCNIL